VSDAAPIHRAVIAIPFFRHPRTVVDVATEARTFHPDVFLVDDGSADSSTERLRAAGFSVIVHDANRGKGAAIRTAAAHARQEGFTHLLILDADGQHPPDEVPALLAASREAPAAIVVGNRRMVEAGAPKANTFGREVSNFMFRLDTGKEPPDVLCGFRVYPVDLLTRTRYRIDRYGFENEVLVRAAWDGVPLVSVPIRVIYPPDRVTHFDLVSDNVRLAGMNILLMAEKAGRALAGRLAGDQDRGNRWDEVEDVGDPFLFRLFMAQVKFLGRTANYALAYFITIYYVLLSPRLVRMVTRFHERVRRITGDPRPVRPLRTTWRQTRQFGGSLIDRISVFVHHSRSFECTHEGVEHVRAVLENPRGSIIVGAHFGNWEVAAVLLKHHYHAVIHVVLFEDQVKKLGKFLKRIQGDTLRFVVLERDWNWNFMKLHGVLKGGGVVAIMGDRVLPGHPSAEVDFLGGKVTLPTGPYTLAAIYGARIVQAFGIKTARNRYHFQALPPREVRFTDRASREAVVAAAAQDFATHLERLVLRHPDQWYNFYDYWNEGDR
jgi:predicted LPLAT superfamily acyltransferase